MERVFPRSVPVWLVPAVLGIGILCSCGGNPLSTDPVRAASDTAAVKRAHTEFIQSLPMYDGLITTNRHPDARDLTPDDIERIRTAALDERGQAVFALVTAGDFSKLSNHLASTNSWGTRERMHAAAMTAYRSGDVRSFEQMMKAQGLSARMERIGTKHDLRHLRQTARAQTQSLTAESLLSGNQDGDIFLCYSAGINSILIDIATGSYWKHAAVLDRSMLTLNPDDPNFSGQRVFLSASDQTGNNPSGSGIGSSGSGTGLGVIAQVGYETIAKWQNETGACSYRVIGRSDADARAALDYGAQFAGKGYSFFCDRWDNENWYCSKVAFRAWHALGVNLEQRYQTSYYFYWVTYTFRVLWWTVTVSVPLLGSQSQWVAANDDLWVSPDDLKDNPSVEFINGDRE